MKRILLLGATGSIGSTVLRSIEPYKDQIGLHGATGFSSLQALEGIKSIYGCRIASSHDDIMALIDSCNYDLVINAIAGTAGFEYSLRACKTGIPLALANKETIVLGGRLALDSASPVIPLDSEHSAIDLLIKAHGRKNIDRILITASGGPFLGRGKDELKSMTAEMAARHPTWSMGRKISIDSATLANKALEILEAKALFDLPIEVVIHPQSIVHSMVLTKSGQFYAQMSPPDMAFPIAQAIVNALGIEQTAYPAPVLDFGSLDLHFQQGPQDGFVGLAMRIKDQKQSLKAAFLASDEVAVEAFCSHRIGFLDIFDIVQRTVEGFEQRDLASSQDCLDCLEEAKEKARSLIG